MVSASPSAWLAVMALFGYTAAGGVEWLAGREGNGFLSLVGIIAGASCLLLLSLQASKGCAGPLGLFCARMLMKQ